VQTGHLFVPAVGLTGEVDDGDDRALVLRVPVGLDDVANGLGEGQRLGQADLSLAGTIEPIVGIGNDGEIALPACRRCAFAVRRESHRREFPVCAVVMIVLSALSVHDL
jgi:hypothetical protein